MSETIKTLRLRVKDRHIKHLNKLSKDTNLVWNYANDLSYRFIREKGIFLSPFDFGPYIKSSYEYIGITMKSVKMICQEYSIRRSQYNKAKLNWRVSNGPRKSLGWIPVSGQDIQFKHGCIIYRKKKYNLFNSKYLEGYDIRSGSFSQDSKGWWFINVTVKVNKVRTKGKGKLGIDLGLKSCATDSNGKGINGRWFREYESKLAIAQRANKKTRVRAIHSKIKNKRLNDIHQYTSNIVKENKVIAVGDVKLKTSKSVNDSAWGMFKSILSYKCDYAGIDYSIVSEAYTTQTCSNCGALPDSRPKGIAGLGIREWTCSACNTTHDRDVNAAKNILAVKCGRPAEGISLIIKENRH